MFSLFRKLQSPAPERPAVTAEAWETVEAGLPALDMLNPEEKQRLRELALDFLQTKEFAGGSDFELTDSIQLGIALTACLPILNLGLDWYEGWVGVIVYPGDFVVPRRITDESGVLHEYEDVVAGEAWQGGPVVLSWFDEPTPGINAILHEFAHKLDMKNGGEADGLPPLHEGMSRRTWAEVFGAAFKDFRQKVHRADWRGEETELDPYGAESPAEFFAVMTEAFFETPLLLQEQYSQVYEQMRLFYRQDPAPREAAWIEAHPDSGQ